MATIALLLLLAFLNLYLATSNPVACEAGAFILHRDSSSQSCSTKSYTDCCEDGKSYAQHHCSPPVTESTLAIMTTFGASAAGFHTNAKREPTIDSTNAKRQPLIDSTDLPGSIQVPPIIDYFVRGSKCRNRSYTDEELVVALSTGWYDGGSRCLKNIKIVVNGKLVVAIVVGECDSVNGCDSDHEFRQPCGNNVVVASMAVWKSLGIVESEVGDHPVTWSDE